MIIYQCLKLKCSLKCPQIVPFYLFYYSFSCQGANSTDPAQFLVARGEWVTISFENWHSLAYCNTIHMTLIYIYIFSNQLQYNISQIGGDNSLYFTHSARCWGNIQNSKLVTETWTGYVGNHQQMNCFFCPQIAVVCYESTIVWSPKRNKYDDMMKRFYLNKHCIRFDSLRLGDSYMHQ